MTETSTTVTNAGTATVGSLDGAELRQPQASTEDKVIGGLSHGVLIIWSLLVIVPLLWVIMSSFKTSSEIFASPFALPQSLQFDN